MEIHARASFREDIKTQAAIKEKRVVRNVGELLFIALSYSLFY
jgi:hypothetical protein